MSTNINQDQEIEINQIIKKVKAFFESITFRMFLAIQFLKKNILLLIGLILVGGGIGYYFDKTNKLYTHQIIVTPNYGTVDYLYEKVGLLNSKIIEKDYKFLKAIQLKNPDKIIKIQIDPVIDIYTFVNNNTAIATNAQNTQNFELVKLLSEEGDINTVIKDPLTSKNYLQHNITILTDGKSNQEDLIKPLLNFLNDNDYFQQVKKIFIENVENRIKEDEIIVRQIDTLLNQFSSKTNSPKTDKLVYYNDNTQLNELISQKSTLIGGIGFQKTQLLNLNKVIFDKSILMNKKFTKGINNKMKIIVPVVFIFLFLLWKFFSSYYKKLKVKYENK